MIRIDEAHPAQAQDDPGRKEAIARLQTIKADGFTHVGFDPSTGLAGATQADVDRGAALTDFVQIERDGKLNEEAISFAMDIANEGF